MGVTHVAVQFPLYEAFKSWAGKSFRAHLQLEIPLTKQIPTETNPPYPHPQSLYVQQPPK
jgi:hypothetical protein